MIKERQIPQRKAGGGPKENHKEGNEEGKEGGK